MGHSRKDPSPPPTEEIDNTPLPLSRHPIEIQDILKTISLPPPWMAEISSVGGVWIFFGTTQFQNPGYFKITL